MKVGNNIQDKGGEPYTCRVQNNEALVPISILSPWCKVHLSSISNPLFFM